MTKKDTKSKIYTDYYPYAIPFDPSKGIDVFKTPDVAPKVDDIDDEFKQKNCYKNNPKIMRSGVNFPYTKEQLIELKKCSEDVIYFIVNYCKVIKLDGGLDLLKLYQYQKNAIKLMHENRFTIYKFPRQMGKAIDEYTLVKTPSGYVFMKDINVGDVVYNSYNEEVKVTYKTEKYLNHVCYSLSFICEGEFEEVICDEGHLWKFYDTLEDKIVVIPTYMLHREPSRYIYYKDGIDLLEIKEVASTAVYCLEVDSSDHMFLITKHDIATHNCVTYDAKVSVDINGTNVDMKIGELYNLIETDNMVESYTPNQDYQILTGNGFKDFDGITTRYADELLKIYYDGGEISCTPEHEILVGDSFKKAKDIIVGENIGVDGKYSIVSFIDKLKGQFKVADVIEVEDTHSYTVNDETAILSNCIDGDSIVTLKDNYTGDVFDVAIKDLYKYLEENDT